MSMSITLKKERKEPTQKENYTKDSIYQAARQNQEDKGEKTKLKVSWDPYTCLSPQISQGYGHIILCNLKVR